MYQETIDKYTKQLDSYLNAKQYKNAVDFLQYHKVKGYTMTAARIKTEFNITKRQLDNAGIHYIELANPHYKCSGNMKCYLIREVEDKITIKAIRRRKLNEILTT